MNGKKFYGFALLYNYELYWAVQKWRELMFVKIFSAVSFLLLQTFFAAWIRKTININLSIWMSVYFHCGCRQSRVIIILHSLIQMSAGNFPFLNSRNLEVLQPFFWGSDFFIQRHETLERWAWKKLKVGNLSVILFLTNNNFTLDNSSLCHLPSVSHLSL